MGIEFRRYLIPRPNTFRPSVDAVLSLVTSLQRDGWLLAGDSHRLGELPFEQSRLYEPAKGRGFFARAVGTHDSFVGPLPDLLTDFAARDLMVVWPVESLSVSGLRYPLEPLPFDDPADAADCYYEIQLHFGHDFIYHCSEYIDPFEPPPVCTCGHNLEYYAESDEDPFYTSRLSATCPECGANFDPTNLAATGRDGWTGEGVRLQGGATYRFALVVDCGKFFGGRELYFHNELKTLVERTLGLQTYEVEDFY